jgi:hypothetical protein
MFNKDKTKINQAKKDLLEKELELWVKEEKYKVRVAVEAARNERDKELQVLAISCANDTKDYEHTFHQARETLGIEIAKLEAKRDTLKEIANQDKITYNTIVDGKNEEIERLTNIIESLISKEQQPITINNNK